MATQLFLIQGNLSNGNNGMGLHEHPGLTSPTNEALLSRVLNTSLSRGAGVDAVTDNSQAGPISPRPMLAGLTPPLASGFTLSGDITFNCWGQVTADCNAGFVALMFRYDSANDEWVWVTSTPFAIGVELTTTNAVRNGTLLAANYTDHVFNANDRIGCYFLSDDAGGNMAAGQTITFRYNGTTGAASGDTYFTLTENVSFSTPAVGGGTVLYMRDTASDIADQGAGITEKEANLGTRGASSKNLVVSSVAGPTSGVAWTVTAGGNEVQWFTPQLNGVTLDGLLLFRLRCIQSAAAAGVAARVEIARVDGDGSNPVVWGRALLCRSSYTANFADSSQQTHDAEIRIAQLTLVGGQRLRIRVLSEDSFTDVGGPQAGGGTGTISYDGPTPGANGDMFLELADTVAVWDGPPAPVTDAYRIQPAAVF